MRNHRNSALAIVEAGTFVGASFIIAACTHAENVALAWTFFGLGMIALVLYSVAYELMKAGGSGGVCRDQRSCTD